MKARQVFIILVIIGLLIFLLFKKKSAHVAVESDDAEQTEKIEKKARLAGPAAVSVPGNTSVSVQNAVLASQPYEVLSANFSKYLADMTHCLGMTGGQPVSGKVDPLPDNLVGAIRSSLGEPVVQMYDWTQTEIIEKNGTIKRIRVDYDYPDGVTPNRRLSMFTINSYGAAEIMNLTDDQMNNPNESYIESLKEGQNVESEERTARLYFAQGEELVFAIKNGKLQSFSLAKANKNFSCSGLDQESSLCSCP